MSYDLKYIKIGTNIMKQNKIVNDTVYGHIPYTTLEENFLKSKIVNRLLFVSQNA